MKHKNIICTYENTAIIKIVTNYFLCTYVIHNLCIYILQNAQKYIYICKVDL